MILNSRFRSTKQLTRGITKNNSYPNVCNLNSILLKNSKFQKLGFFIFLLLMTSFSNLQLGAHHTGSTDNPNTTTRFIDPFTGKREQPANYFVLSQDYFKGTNENSNLFTTTAFVEVPFADGKFAINGSVPWTYFQQKDRSDSARIGKPYIGGKWLPLGDFERNYFIVVNGAVGFPSGPDTDRFTGGNYYSGQGVLTLGYQWEDWSFVTKVGGVVPLSKAQPSNLQDNDGIPFWLRPPSAQAPEGQYELKKSTVIQGYITYYWKPTISTFGGILYRTPYQGVDFDRETRDTIPRIFREGTLGLSYNFSEKYNVVLAYRHPFYRESDHRLYDAAWTVAFSMEWGNTARNEVDTEIKDNIPTSLGKESTPEN